MMKQVLLACIHFYQIYISPLLGPHCRFYPTCSHYACEAIESWGPLRGFLMGIGRLLRCHPFHPGGYDPVPQPQSGFHHKRE